MIAMYQTMCHSLSLVFRRGPPHHPHLLLHHLHRRIPYLMSTDTPKIPQPKEVEVRVRSYGETRCMDQQKPKTQKHEGHEEVQSDLLHELLDWLQEFREKLVDERNPSEPRGNSAPKDQDTSSSSHESPMELRAKVEPGSGKHSVFTHFQKDPNCEKCLKTKITRDSCRRRAGTVVPKAENLVI